MASCSAVSNCGSSPCSPPSGGRRVAPVPPQAANLTRLARDRRGNARSGRRNRRLDRTKEHGLARIACCRADHSTATVFHPMVGGTANAPHTEILTVPRDVTCREDQARASGPRRVPRHCAHAHRPRPTSVTVVGVDGPRRHSRSSRTSSTSPSIAWQRSKPFGGREPNDPAASVLPEPDVACKNVI